MVEEPDAVLFLRFLVVLLLTQGMVCQGAIPFVVFSLASSAGYLVNDLMDREADSNHPRKSSVPWRQYGSLLRLPKTLAVLLAASAIVVAMTVGTTFTSFVLAYLSVSIAYSCCLKNIPVVDLFCIATGFLFRLMAEGLSSTSVFLNGCFYP